MPAAANVPHDEDERDKRDEHGPPVIGNKVTHSLASSGPGEIELTSALRHGIE
jgi:hypothetical protein